ncbi:MAG: MarR family transcriptional regulator [Clostridia bacterium]|nr:MarR family transcriptional regulator [Clostridia bacterium]
MSLGKSMRSHCHRAIEADGFSLNESDVLLALSATPENNTVTAISEASGISKGNISTAVETLRQKGYVTVAVDPADRRLLTVALTEKAAPVLEKLAAAEDEYFSGFMRSIDRGNVSLVNRIFSAVQQFSPTAFLKKLSGKDNDDEKN